jgi:hypothetical protein
MLEDPSGSASGDLRTGWVAIPSQALLLSQDGRNAGAEAARFLTALREVEDKARRERLLLVSSATKAPPYRPD